jgi:VWFA-related protein
MSIGCRRFIAVVALFCVAATTPAATTGVAIPHLGETVDVSIVNVDVFVTDARGNRVRGLTPGDFEIYENGKLQPVSNFAEYRDSVQGGSVGSIGEVGIEGIGAAATAPRQPRTVAIFFERIRLAPFVSKPLFASMKDILRKTVAPGDAVSLVVWNRYSTEQLEFTDDLEAVETALDKLEAESQKMNVDPLSMQHDEAALQTQFEKRVEALTGNGTAAILNNNTPTLAMLVAMVEMKQRVAAINSTINSMSGGEGKKVLLLVPRRLGEVAGAEFAYVGGADVIPAEDRNRFGTRALIGSIINNANANGVTIYPLYPAGIGSSSNEVTPFDDGSNARTQLNETVNLDHLAKETGGLSAISAKDVVELMPKIGEDVTDYYSLAYRVSASGEDRARDIVVKVKDRDLRVRARRQFVEKSDDTRMKDRLTATLFRDQLDSPIAIVAQLGKARKARKNSTIPLRIRIPISALTVLPQDGGKQAGAFSVYVGTASDLDEVSNVTEKTQSFQIAERDLKKAMDGYFTYDLDVVVNPKAKYVAVGVLDEVSKSYGLRRLDLPGHESRQASAR